MALGRRDHVLDAVVDQLHRPARLAREQRRVPGDHRRIFFLAAEAAAGLGLHDADLVARQAEQHHQRAVHVVRALHRAVDGDAVAIVRHAVAGHGDDAVGLDVELLLVPDPVLAFDDDVGERRSRPSTSPFSIADRLEHRRRRLGVVHRRRRRDSRSGRRPRAASRDPRAPAAGSARRHGESRARPGTADRPRSARRCCGRECRVKSTMVKPAVSKLKRMPAISPAGIVERIVRACSRPGNERSSMYCAAPVTFAAPSLRSTLRPTAVRRARHRDDYTKGSGVVFRRSSTQRLRPRFRPIIVATPRLVARHRLAVHVGGENRGMDVALAADRPWCCPAAWRRTRSPPRRCAWLRSAT